MRKFGKGGHPGKFPLIEALDLVGESISSCNASPPKERPMINEGKLKKSLVGRGGGVPYYLTTGVSWKGPKLEGETPFVQGGTMSD